MATEHFCLRWNNHQSTLVSVFDNLLESGTLVDCTLAADGRYLKAHKVVLSACSPYLGMLLSQHYDKHPIIILKDVKFEELKAMLDYMYRGEVNISQEQLSTFLKAAESLQIKGLTDTGSEEGTGLQPNRPPSSSSTTSLPTEDPQSPGGDLGSSPSPKKRKRNKHSDEPPDCESGTKLAGTDGSDWLTRDGGNVSTPTNTGSPSSMRNVNANFGSVKREPTDVDGDGLMSMDDTISGDSALLSRPGPSNGGATNNKGSPWILSADSTGEEMQLTPGQDAAHYKKILKVEEPEIKQEPTSCEAPLKEEADIKQEQSTCEEEQQNSKDHKTCSSDSLFSATAKKNYVEIYNKGVDELIVPDMLENTPLSDFHEKNIDALWSASEKRKSFSLSSEANDLQVNKQLKLLPKESKNSNKLLPEQNSEIENSSSSDDCQFLEYKIKKTRIMPDRRTLGRKFIPRLCKQTNVQTSVSSCLPTVANDGSNLQICEDPLGNPSDILQPSVSSASGKSVIASHTQFTHVGNRTGSQEINSSITSSSNHFRDTQANKVKLNLVNKASLSSVSKKVFDVVSRFRKIVPAPQDNERTGTSCSPTVQEPNTNLKLTETVLSQPNTNTQQLQQLVTPGQYISYTNPIQTNTPSSRQHLQNSLGLQIQPQFTISPSQIQSTLLPQTSTTMTLPQPHISSTVQQIPGSALNLIQSGFSLPASTNIETITGMLQQSFTNSGEMVLQGRQSINSQSVLINQQGPSYAMQQPVFISSGSTSSQETPPQFIMPSRQGSLKKISVYKVVRTKNVGTSDVLPVDPLSQGVRLGRPPNRVGRPPNRLGRPPNRLSSPRYIRPQLTSYRRIEAKIVGEIEKENEVDQN